jgi:putative acetyltransferase
VAAPHSNGQLSNAKPIISLRPAVATDAEEIARVRHSAIHRIAAAAYPPEAIEAWSGTLDERRYQRFRDVISGGEERIYIAEHASTVVGFGSVIPARNELRAVYVDGDWVRCGVGTAIVQCLEAVAREFGCTCLDLESSLNAKEFYLAHGYVELSQATHGLRDEYAMACVVMRKSIAIAS